jgi:hypothetical protein
VILITVGASLQNCGFLLGLVSMVLFDWGIGLDPSRPRRIERLARLRQDQRRQTGGAGGGAHQKIAGGRPNWPPGHQRRREEHQNKEEDMRISHGVLRR